MNSISITIILLGLSFLNFFPAFPFPPSALRPPPHPCRSARVWLVASAALEDKARVVYKHQRRMKQAGAEVYTAEHEAHGNG